MNWGSPRDNAVYKVSGGRKQFAERGIEFPQVVADALAVLDRIEAETPKTPSQTAIREAILAGTTGDNVDRLILADLGAQRLRTEHEQARIEAALLALRAIRGAHDAIYPQLKAQADRAIAHLEAVARMDGARLEDLVRDGRHDDAQLLVSVEATATELSQLWTMRDSYLFDRNGATVGMIDCSRWRDPRISSHHSRGDETLVQVLIKGLRRGGELWFPTQGEAIAAAEPIVAESERKASELAAKQRAQGFTVAVT